MTAAIPFTSKPLGDGGITLIKRTPKKRRLNREILGLLAVSVIISLTAFALLAFGALHIVDSYFQQNLLTYTENQLISAQRWALNGCVAAALFFFAALFLFLLRRKLAYIDTLTRGVEALQQHMDHVVPVEGCNELTELAETINYLSASQRRLQEKEEALQRERTQLIRTLSHDIRTPLTSILSYTEYLSAHPDGDPRQRQDYLDLMGQKARQIRQLTDLLLDGGSRNIQRFDDARLLLQQLAAQMEAELEDDFIFTADFSACPAFAGSFDVAELQRIFDNLSSNIRKYAQPAAPVTLAVTVDGGTLRLIQSNTVGDNTAAEGHRIGLLSIRRIAQHYSGTAEVVTENGIFTITVTLSDF